MQLNQVKALRKFFIPLFSKINFGNIRINHHYTGERLLLHSFTHKDYWYHGKRREHETMLAFQSILQPDDTVIEIGGHIGYISLWFAHLVGPNGNVHVFEPGENNLPYIRTNTGTKPNISLVEKGAGSKNETLSFFLDSITGQNNSFLGEHGAFTLTREHAYVKSQLRKVDVQVITVDEYVTERNLVPKLVKIDVESYECEVLKGLEETLRKHKPTVMVEIASENTDWVYEKMEQLGYVGYTPTMEKANRTTRDNVFFIHMEKDK